MSVAVAVAVAVELQAAPARGLTLVDGRVRRRLGELRIAAAAAKLGGFHEALLDVFGEARPRELGDFLLRGGRG